MPHGVEQQQTTTTESSDSFNLGRRNSGRLFGKSRNVDNADSDDGLSPTTTTTTMSSAVMSLKKQESQFHKLFPTIPQQELLLETYSCALKKDFLYHGKMFVSQNWICFHSRIIHKQLQVTIPVGSVRTIKKHRMVKLLPNALCLLTSDGTKYRFTSLMSRDTTYNHLHSLCKNLEDHNSEAALPCPDPSHSAPSRRPRPRSLLLNPPEEFSRSVRRRASCQDQALARTPLSGDFQGSYCTQCETPPRIDSPDGAPPSRHGDGEDDDSDGGRRGSTPRSDSEDGSPTRGAESGNSGRDPPRCNGHAKGPPGWPCPALTDPGPAGKKRSLSLLWLYLFIVLLLVLVSCYMAVRINLLEEMLARIAIPPKPPLRPQR
nr:GRAM domain-containing protein 2A-like isoform X2 [Petromyzon marinus]